MPPDSTKKLVTSPLAGYSRRQRTVIKIAAAAFYSLIKFIGAATKFEVENEDVLAAVRSAGHLPIFSVWHDRIILGTYFLRHRSIVFLASQSFDGEYIARVLTRFGFGVARGSSTRGGAKGLVEMIRRMKAGASAGFTVDGPKGPRYKVKYGPILLAKKTGNPIVPFIVEPSRYRVANSWDRLQIPIPFSGAKVIFGEPIYVDSFANDAEMTRKSDELQQAMDALLSRAEKWRKAL